MTLDEVWVVSEATEDGTDRAPTRPAGTSFEEWYRFEHPRLTAVLSRLGARPEVARDLAAEAFSRALERWEHVASLASPSGWVFQVGLNLLRRYARRAALEARLLGRPVQPTEAPAGSEIWEVVRHLPPRQRQAVVLVYLLDLPYSEAARLLGVAEGTVAATLSAARRRLATELRDPALGEDDHG